MMKRIIVILIIISASFSYAQEKKKTEGTVSFVSARNVYVQFHSTEGILKGDTLFIESQGLKPALIVSFLSSTSIASEKIIPGKISAGTKVIAFARIPEIRETVETGKKLVEVKNSKRKTRSKSTDERFTGKFGVTSYSNFSNTTTNADFQRWRYALSFGAWNILKSNLSFTTYSTLNYRADQWADVKKNLSNSLRIYDLALNYKFSEKTSLWIGRRINQKVANISVLDGGSFEINSGNFSFGVLAGSRPNPSDFGVNFNFFEYGGYLSRTDSAGSGLMTNTLAVVQQMNHSNTDRRFLYFQHSNSTFKNINLFFSSEIDLYKNINGTSESIFRLTGLYLSLRYRFSRNVSFSASYDERKNVIYYETYKTYAERLFDEAVRRGFRFRINLRPSRYVSVNINGGVRNRDGDSKVSINAGGSVTHSKLPVYNLSGTLNANFINTSFLTGGIVGIRFNRNYFDGFLSASVLLKGIFYSYGIGELFINQNVLGIDLSMNLMRRLSLTFTYEGVYEGRDTFGRVFVGLNQRF